MLRLSPLLLLAACSSDPVNPPDASADAPSDTHVGFPDSGSDAEADAPCVPAVCPTSLPSAGSSCTSTSLFCEYGSAAWSQCDTFAMCTGNVWQIMPAPDAGYCATNPSCPASYGDTPDGGASCGSTQYVCYYQEGTCGCVNGAWACTLPNASACGAQRPHLGTACSTTATCNYGKDCSALNGDMLECKCGTWQEQPPPLCPP